jgi:predicted DCC family thiol-disulfide oxidoreductase YuxK
MAYQDAPSPPMAEELHAACAQAVHVVTAEGRVLRAGSACLFLLSEAGHPTLSRLLGSPLLLPLVELGYRVVARNRRFWSRFLYREPS